MDFQFVLAQIDAECLSMTAWSSQSVSCMEMMDFIWNHRVERTKSVVSRVSTWLSPRGRNSKDTARTQRFRVAVRSSMTHYCSGSDMDKVHLEFYGDACTRICAHRQRHLTYVMMMRNFRPTLTLLWCYQHREMRTILLLRIPLWNGFIQFKSLHLCHAQLDLKCVHETKIQFLTE